ncbi:MAG: FMN-binding negative transcriptional regulator [Protaetiibacter sp.]
MWINPQYLPDEPEFALEFVNAHPLGVLVVDGMLHAAHVPMLAVEGAEAGRISHLIGHVAVADPIARRLTLPGVRALAIHVGPAAYITPRWYSDPGLPTYNFGAVHVTGAVRTLTEDELRAHLVELIAVHENTHVHVRHEPWSMDDPALERMESLLPRIIGFVIEPDRIEAKLKVGQNRRPSEIVDAARALAGSADRGDRLVADDMERVARMRIDREGRRG